MQWHRIPLNERPGSGIWAEIRFSDVGDGDFRVVDPTPGLERRRRDIVDAPWSWINQIHGTTVLTVSEPGEHAGAEADGLITVEPGCPIAVTTADCGPVVLLAEHGVAIVHAGWRGLADGIIGKAGGQLATVGGSPVATLLGPCIGPEAYEFGPEELDLVADRLGPGVRGRTGEGKPALDVPTAVALACQQVGWPAPERPSCTSDRRWFSHRTRADRGRQTAVAWLTENED